MKIKKLRIGFENVEYIDIPIEFVEAFAINGAKKTIVYLNNTEREYESCEIFLIDIKSEAFELMTSISDETLFNRIQKFQDIVVVELFYDDGTSRIITVPWKGAFEINDYQTCTLRNNGNLLVIVDPNDKAENYR